MEDLTSELQRLLVKLDDPNKIERKKSLEKLKSFVEQKFPKIEIDDENRSADALSLWQDRLCRPLIRSIGSDSSERVREISAEIVFYLLDRFPSYGTETSSGSDYMKMAYLFPLLQSRLVNISSNLNSIRIFKSKLAKDLKIYFHLIQSLLSLYVNITADVIYKSDDSLKVLQNITRIPKVRF